jgi:DNA repair protein RAD5
MKPLNLGSTKASRPKKKGRQFQPMLSFNFESDLFFSVLRERKQAIVKLFDLVGLKPQAGANVKGKSAEFNITEEVSKKSAKRPVKKIKEIVGDGEEIEVEDTEDLSRNDIEAIYTRWSPFLF